MNRVKNFNAGPAALPLPALERARDEFLDFAGSGMSVMEHSHRGKEYEACHDEAIALLNTTPEAAIMLIDIMMPEMDGYQTIQIIRQKPQYRRLPIIALTAKAMVGDREKCLQAGASDYLAKPVNTEQLLSALRMWLHR